MGRVYAWKNPQNHKLLWKTPSHAEAAPSLKDLHTRLICLWRAQRRLSLISNLNLFQAQEAEAISLRLDGFGYVTPTWVFEELRFSLE